MKTFALLAVFLFAFSYATDPNESKSLEKEDVKEIAEFVKDKFNSTIIFEVMELAKMAKDECPDIEDKMEHAAEGMSECASNIELGSDTFCSLIRKHWQKCSQPGFDAVASCLPKESKALPAMVGKIIWALMDRACNSTVEEILELFNPCGVSEEADKSPACSHMKETLISYKGKIPTKTFACSMIPKVKDCAKVHEEGCTNPVTKAAYLHFHEAIEDAVEEDCKA